jgi:antitoxin component YwqK of YwqJK toxin-antitoxin module
MPDINYLISDLKNGKYYLEDSAHVILKRFNIKNFKLDSFCTSMHIERHSDYSFTFPIVIYFRDGVWKYYDETAKLIKEEFYQKGKLIKTESKY